MGKDIKDYLHLYLGCEVERDNAAFKGEKVTQILTTPLLMQVELSGNYYNIIPILRPLSDMTENEKSLLKINVFQAACLDRFNKDVMWTFDQVKILLSKHFDLFGLIESGLAIDKTKMKNYE